MVSFALERKLLGRRMKERKTENDLMVMLKDQVALGSLRKWIFPL